MQKYRKLIIAGAAVIVLAILSVGGFFLYKALTKQVVSAEEPTDIVKGFYQSWLDAAHSTTTNPYALGLQKNPILSPELRKRVSSAEKAKDGLDPVLCQSVLPEKINTRTVFKLEDKTQILVTASKATTTEQAIVTLLHTPEGWYINEIKCSAGDIGVDREFSFDTDGYLLKSDAKPLDGKHWYLVFEENGEKGHFVPLLLSPESMCTTVTGVTAVCNPDVFVQASKAHVQGQMTETGVTVKTIKVLK